VLELAYKRLAGCNFILNEVPALPRNPRAVALRALRGERLRLFHRLTVAMLGWVAMSGEALAYAPARGLNGIARKTYSLRSLWEVQS
jgi:hypothetical protein